MICRDRLIGTGNMRLVNPQKSFFTCQLQKKFSLIYYKNKPLPFFNIVWKNCVSLYSKNFVVTDGSLDFNRCDSPYLMYNN